MKPMFSVIVPIYKVEKYLKQCLDSLLQQTYSDIEIILVDDGSPDDCPVICDTYAQRDKRIQVIHKQNEGVVSARQAGVAAALGEYIVCVDGDDWVAKDYLEKFEKVVYQYHPDTICCGYNEVEDNRVKPIRDVNLKGFYDRKALESCIFPILIERADGASFPPNLWAKAFKREIYQKQQVIDLNIVMGEDVACTKPCIYHSNSMFIMDECLYYYRYNPSSTTKGKKSFPWDGPALRAQHLAKQINMNDYDFQAQLYRNTVRALFTVASSQFNRKDASYKIISMDIKEKMSEACYKEAINNCVFKGNTKMKLMHIVLKYKWTRFMNLYCKLKL